MNNKVAIEILSMDLLRIANGLHKGSVKTAKIFSDEALISCSEIDINQLDPHFVKIIKSIHQCLSDQPCERTAEDALMYSIVCKNYTRKYLS